MQLLSDGYEVPEMTKLTVSSDLHDSRSGSASSVDRRVGDSWPRSTRARSSRSRSTRGGGSGGWPAAASVLRPRWSMAATTLSVFKVNAQIATQANPHWGMQAGPRGLAHMCGLPAGAHVPLVG